MNMSFARFAHPSSTCRKIQNPKFPIAAWITPTLYIQDAAPQHSAPALKRNIFSDNYHVGT
jgi:hypothetical protein